jgi:CheY-like chemotaxis protein
MVSLVGKVVLMAEDEAFTRRVLSTALQRLGAQIIDCADGKRALAALNEPRRIDVALLDILMPEMHGFFVLREIRGGRTRQDYAMPVALLTATQDEASVHYAAGLSCDGFILKPIGQQALSERLDRMLRRRMQLPYAPPHYAAIDVGPPDQPPRMPGEHVIIQAPPPVSGDPVITTAPLPGMAGEHVITEAPLPDDPDDGGQAVLTRQSVPVEELRVGMVLTAPIHARGRMLVPPMTPVTPELLTLPRELNRVEALPAIQVQPHLVAVL